jgi:hypothetical protein
MAGRRAPHIVALGDPEKQNIWRQDPVVTNMESLKLAGNKCHCIRQDAR